MRGRGFTLLEVLIALAVIALGLVALLQSGAGSARELERLREQTFATWVAADAITRVRLAEGFPPVSRRDGVARMGPRDWYWEMVIQATTDPQLRRLDVRVYRDPARTEPVTSLTGFAGQP